MPEEAVSFEVLGDKLERLAGMDNLVLNLLANEIEGAPERVFTEDYAVWTHGVFLP